MGAGVREGSVPCDEPYSCPYLLTPEKSSLNELSNGKKIPVVREPLISLKCGPGFSPQHELPANIKSRKNSYLKRSDSKVTKTTNVHGFSSHSTPRNAYTHACTKWWTHRGIRWCSVLKTKGWKLSKWHHQGSGSWNPGTLIEQTPRLTKMYKENLDTIYVVMWDDLQHT